MAKAGRASSRAEARPGASSRLESTTAISTPGRRCVRIASAMARKFDPRPESRIPRRFKALLSSVNRWCGRQYVRLVGCRLLQSGRGRAYLRLDLLDRLVELCRVGHQHPVVVGADEDGWRLAEPHLL